MEKLKKRLEIDIVLTSDNTFDLKFYEPESGEFKRVACKDNPDAFTEVHENIAIGNEIRSWVSLLREEQEDLNGYERDAFEDELEEIKYYELCYFYGRKDSGSIYIKTTLDKDLYYEDEFLQKLVDRNELDVSEVDAIVEIEEIDEETYRDMTGR